LTGLAGCLTDVESLQYRRPCFFDRASAYRVARAVARTGAVPPRRRGRAWVAVEVRSRMGREFAPVQVARMVVG